MNFGSKNIGNLVEFGRELGKESIDLFLFALVDNRPEEGELDGKRDDSSARENVAKNGNNPENCHKFERDSHVLESVNAAKIIESGIDRQNNRSDMQLKIFVGKL